MTNEVWVIYYTESDYSSSTDYHVGFCTSQVSAENTCHMLDRVHQVMQETDFDHSDICKEYQKEFDAKKELFDKALTKIEGEFPKGMPNRQAKIVAYTARVRHEIYGELERSIMDSRTTYDHQQKVIDYFNDDDYTNLIKLTFKRKAEEYFEYTSSHQYIKLPNLSGVNT